MNKHVRNKLEFPNVLCVFPNFTPKLLVSLLCRRSSPKKFTRFSGTEKQPKHKVFWRDIPGTSGTQTLGYPRHKLYASGLFLLFLTGSGRDVAGFGSGRPGFGTLHARKLWADFSFPRIFPIADLKPQEISLQHAPAGIQGEKKPINRKHINIFLTALVGQLSQGRTPTVPRDKRDKMAILLWNSTEKGRFVPENGSHFVPGRGPVCPRDGSCLSQRPSRRKWLCLLVFSCPKVWPPWHCADFASLWSDSLLPLEGGLHEDNAWQLLCSTTPPPGIFQPIVRHAVTMFRLWDNYFLVRLHLPLDLCISGRASEPKQQKNESAQKVGFHRFQKECQKCGEPHFLRTFYAKSAVFRTFPHFLALFWNRRKPHFLCRLMFLLFWALRLDRKYTTLDSEELKKAVAVSEEKVQQRSRRCGQFPTAVFLAGECPNLGRDSILCCRKIGGEFSRQRRNLPENLSSKEFRTATAFSSFLIDGRNRAITIAESLARVIAAIRIASVRWRSYLPQKTESSPHRPCVRCAAIRIARLAVHSFNVRSTWSCGMACESWLRSLNASDWRLRFCRSKHLPYLYWYSLQCAFSAFKI